MVIFGDIFRWIGLEGDIKGILVVFVIIYFFRKKFIWGKYVKILIFIRFGWWEY